MDDGKKRGGGGRLAPSKGKTVKQSLQQKVRARNEDDDGYDPYSDYHDQGSSELQVEEDPWADR